MVSFKKKRYLVMILVIGLYGCGKTNHKEKINPDQRNSGGATVTKFSKSLVNQCQFLSQKVGIFNLLNLKTVWTSPPLDKSQSAAIATTGIRLFNVGSDTSQIDDSSLMGQYLLQDPDSLISSIGRLNDVIETNSNLSVTAQTCEEVTFLDADGTSKYSVVLKESSPRALALHQGLLPTGHNRRRYFLASENSLEWTDTQIVTVKLCNDAEKEVLAERRFVLSVGQTEIEKSIPAAYDLAVHFKNLFYLPDDVFALIPKSEARDKSDPRHPRVKGKNQGLVQIPQAIYHHIAAELAEARKSLQPSQRPKNMKLVDCPPKNN